MKKILPNPEHVTPEELEVAKESTPDKQHYIRLYGIQMLLEGKTRKEVSKAFNWDRNTVAQRVKRWNEGGIDALRTIRRPGRPQKLSESQVTELKELLLTPEEAGVDHWIIVKLQGHLSRLWGTDLKYTTLLNYVERLGFCQAVPRSWPENQDEEAREQFVRELTALMSDPKNEVWFGDASGFIAESRPRKRWVLIGSRPKFPYTGLHIRQSVIGAVEPRSGEFEALVVPEVDAEIFQLFLDQLVKAISRWGTAIFRYIGRPDFFVTNTVQEPFCRSMCLASSRQISLNETTVGRQIRKLSAETGIAFTPKTFRKDFACRMEEAGADEGVINVHQWRGQTGTLYKSYIKFPDRAVKLCRPYINLMFGEKTRLTRAI